MDRIRTALDKARQQREFGAEPAVRTPGPGPTRAARPAAELLPARIEYTSTQTFAPDPGILESHRIMHPASREPAAAAYRMLRTQVMQRMDAHGWRSVAVLSPGADDGKTTTAVNLAISLANDRHHTVLLIDCDLKRPGVAGMFGLTVPQGVDDVLRGDAQLSECLHHPEPFERLVVLPARGPLENSSEALAGPQGRSLVGDVRGRYPERIVIFDLPPVLGCDDALAFLPQVECALVVVAEQATRREDLLRCMELIRNTPVLGTVLNRSSGLEAAYG